MPKCGGQLLVLGAIGVALLAADAVLLRVRARQAASAAWSDRLSVFRMRVVGLSLAVGVVAMVWTVERRPW